MRCRAPVLALAALAATVVVLVPARPARASSRCRGRCGPAPILVELSIGATELHLTDRSFAGSGVPAGLDGRAIGPATTLRADGRTLGLRQPLVAQWQLHLLWLTPWHLAVGGLIGGTSGDAGGPLRRLDGQTVDPTIGGATVGPEIAAVFGHGPLELRAGFAFGYRSIELPVTSFVEVSCGKGGRCHPTVSDAEPFFEPRVAVGLHLGSIELGGYAGGDLGPGGGWSAGGFVALATPDWRSRAALRPR